ncbi:hypothetical protein Dvina_11530 [Dactylosporangium vinaceum]|uniref:Cell wall-active antibiotics response protein n=1 Tax=Dactylosporangium vinaceum TaxID=53362 RepID=A0ABV5MFT7_9ACTN|nr:cell wall-active antibiotics response protein [Dactylosporangium vinaceum]UAB98656.1 hypothetical protein Dvina_11530 [Dactylosporangium vinaceum]
MASVDTRPNETPAPSGPPPRTVYIVGGVIVVVLIAVAAVLAVVWPQMHGENANDTAHTVTGAVNGRDHATLDLVTGATSVNMQAADLGDTLYRVDTPQTASVHDTGERIEVQVTDGNAEVTIQLNRDVTWAVRFTGGAQSNTADLRSLKHLASVEYVGGVSAIDVTLPTPTGTVPVRVDGGASAVRVIAPSGTPVRVQAAGGAGRVTVDGTEHSGVGAGGTFPSNGWDAAQNRYDVVAAGGVSAFTVEHT